LFERSDPRPEYLPYFYGLFATKTQGYDPGSGLEMPGYWTQEELVHASVTEEGLHISGDTFVARQNRILERVAAGASLCEVLTRIVQLVESQTPEMVCSILLVDDDGLCLRHGAAPSLSESYINAIDGMSIGPKAGSCGTAVYLKDTVVVTDIYNDPLWDSFRDLAIEHGLRACWSSPIMSQDEVMGTFAMYYRVPRGPIPEELRLSQIALQIASIAIERSRTEQKLRESEQRSRAILRAIPDSMFLLDSDFRYLECQTRSSCRLQIPSGQLLGKRMSDILPPELADKFARTLQIAAETQVPQLVEYDVSINGEIRYNEARIVHTSDGKFLALVRDITERKHSEEALKKNEEELRRVNAQIRQLAGRLMTAQEEERRRIARALQDDLNQKAAALSFVVSSVKYQLPTRSEELDKQLDLLQRCAVEMAEGMRRLSHELHPAVLEHVGLAAALKAYVAEFSRLEKIEIGLTVPDDVTTIPSGAAICLYRVAQESLFNIMRHSGAKYAEVALTLDDQAVRLRITDWGSGFDLISARKKGGLGLASMEERLRWMQGSFSISTHPGRGSQMMATIPLQR
jgi:PAS domain S-box-containing protein